MVYLLQCSLINLLLVPFVFPMFYHIWPKSLEHFYYLFRTSRSHISHPLLFDQRLCTSLCLPGILCEFMLWMQRSADEKEDACQCQCDWNIFSVYVYSFVHILDIFESELRNLKDWRTLLPWIPEFLLNPEIYIHIFYAC